MQRIQKWAKQIWSLPLWSLKSSVDCGWEQSSNNHVWGGKGEARANHVRNWGDGLSQTVRDLQYHAREMEIARPLWQFSILSTISSFKVCDSPLKSLFPSHPPPHPCTITPTANKSDFSNEKIMLCSVLGRSLRWPHDLQHSGVALVIMLWYTAKGILQIQLRLLIRRP